MPVNKNALLRYRIIDSCLTNPKRKYPEMDFILSKIEAQIGEPISESMFNKDIQQMKEIYKAPIKFDRYHKGYHYTEDDFSIKEFPLNHDEIEALDYSTALLQQLKGTKMFQQFENAINKVIEGYRVSKILGKSETQILQVEEPLKTEGSQWLEILLKSIVEKTAVTIGYQGYGKDEKVHTLSPYLLKEYRNRWYIIGFSNRKESILVFALDRIKHLATSKDKYMAQENFSPEQYFKYSFGITHLHGEKPEQVLLTFSAREAPYILSQPLHHSQVTIKETVNELQIELQVYITSELKMTILSYGKEVEVIKPEMLRNEIADMIKDMSKLYKKY